MADFTSKFENVLLLIVCCALLLLPVVVALAVSIIKRRATIDLVAPGLHASISFGRTDPGALDDTSSKQPLAK